MAGNVRLAAKNLTVVLLTRDDIASIQIAALRQLRVRDFVCSKTG